MTAVGKRRLRRVVVLAGALLVTFVAVLLASYPLHRASQDRADDRFRQMSIEVTRDFTRFWPAGAETVNRPVVSATCSHAFSDVKAQELTTCPNLAELDLSQCDFVDPRALARLSALRVRTLSLAGTPVDDGVLPVLATWPALRDLNLDRTGVTAGGVRAFLGQRQMKRLSVSGAKLSPAEAKELRDAFPDVKIQF
ncbi:MAG TPA: hypothetical protein VKD90_19645 [Gemmataceae bacterium]|nr:hypothetical protein [Gemmataceae bacterium]